MRQLIAEWLQRGATTAVVATALLIAANGAQAGVDQRLSASGVTVAGGTVSFDVPLCVLSTEVEAGGGRHSVTVDAAGKLRADTISAKSVTVVGLLGRDACPQHSIFFDIAQATNWAVEEGEAP